MGRAALTVRRPARRRGVVSLQLLTGQKNIGGCLPLASHWTMADLSGRGDVPHR